MIPIGNNKKLPRIPAPLNAGDTVAVVAPCSPPPAESLEKGVRFLRALNIKVVFGENIGRRRDYLAGSDSERAADLNNMFGDPVVRAILLARGGYGSMRILERLDLQTLARDPKILCGMSDVTALQLFLYKALHLVTFSGPMVAGQLGQGLDRWSEESYVRALFKKWIGGDALGVERLQIKVLKHGSAIGPLLGGCLSIVSALIGTPYMPEMSNIILMLEDVNEPLYRLDRMFTQLRLAGIYDSISGMVLGHFVGPDGSDLTSDVDDLVRERTNGFGFPIIARFPHGHKLPNLTLPHGMLARLDTSVPSLVFFS